MWIKPFGLEQAMQVTYLKTFIQNMMFEKAIRHTKNPCGEILLREKIRWDIYQREVVRWVGEPGMTQLNELEIGKRYMEEEFKCTGRRRY